MNLLAFDTGTESMSIAVARTVAGQQRLWQDTAIGGAQASTGLIASILDLLNQAGLKLDALDAICFGAGPGSFTGLRTACSVAQGLAFGAKVQVLPVDSLLAVAEEARHAALADQPQGVVTALLDARMNEVYVATYAFEGPHWTQLQGGALVRPQDLGTYLRAMQHKLDLPEGTLAGNVFGVYGERLQVGQRESTRSIAALPTAAALLRLAPQLLAAGLAVEAEHALPLYIRDKVAQTTLERAADKAATLAAATITPEV